MNCSTATDLMLEADTRELTGEGDSALAMHLQSCERCRALASRFIDGQLELARELDTTEPKYSVDEALRFAELKSGAVSRRNALWRFGTPLAAAAGIAALVLLGPGNVDTGVLVHANVPAPLPGLEVTGPPGKDVAVFKVTDHPDIVVVWFLDAGDE